MLLHSKSKLDWGYVGTSRGLELGEEGTGGPLPGPGGSLGHGGFLNRRGHMAPWLPGQSWTPSPLVTKL